MTELQLDASQPLSAREIALLDTVLKVRAGTSRTLETPTQHTGDGGSLMTYRAPSRSVKIKPYDGKSNPEQWFLQYESYCRLSGFEKHEYAPNLILHVKDDALAFISAWMQDNGQTPETMHTVSWEELKRNFLEGALKSSDSPVSLRRKLKLLKLTPGKEWAAFVLEFQTLLTKAPKIDRETAVFFFVEALPDVLAARLCVNVAAANLWEDLSAVQKCAHEIFSQFSQADLFPAVTKAENGAGAQKRFRWAESATNSGDRRQEHARIPAPTHDITGKKLTDSDWDEAREKKICVYCKSKHKFYQCAQWKKQCEKQR